MASDKALGRWSTVGNREFLKKIFFLHPKKEVHMGGFWLKALMAMIIGRALWPGSSHGGAGEQPMQDHDREYGQGYEEGYHDGYEEGFHEHDDPDFFDGDFFE